MERCFTARTNTHTSLIAVVPGQNYTIDKFTLPGQAIWTRAGWPLYIMGIRVCCHLKGR